MPEPPEIAPHAERHGRKWPEVGRLPDLRIPSGEEPDPRGVAEEQSCRGKERPGLVARPSGCFFIADSFRRWRRGRRHLRPLSAILSDRRSQVAFPQGPLTGGESPHPSASRRCARVRRPAGFALVQDRGGGAGYEPP